VHIDFPTLIVRQDKVKRSFDFPFRPTVAPRRQEMLEPDYILVFDRDIQIFMRPSLPAMQGIDTPSAMNPDVNAKLRQSRVDLDHIRRCHADIPL
jgi:hypothetical protein